MRRGENIREGKQNQEGKERLVGEGGIREENRVRGVGLPGRDVVTSGRDVVTPARWHFVGHSPSPHPTLPTPGMPDFLEKLHTAALKAKKLELEVRDYMAARPADSEGKAGMAAPEHKADGSCGSAQLEFA